jgi:hypothetical protein
VTCQDKDKEKVIFKTNENIKTSTYTNIVMVYTYQNIVMVTYKHITNIVMVTYPPQLSIEIELEMACGYESAQANVV